VPAVSRSRSQRADPMYSMLLLDRLWRLFTILGVRPSTTTSGVSTRRYGQSVRSAQDESPMTVHGPPRPVADEVKERDSVSDVNPTASAMVRVSPNVASIGLEPALDVLAHRLHRP